MQAFGTLYNQSIKSNAPGILITLVLAAPAWAVGNAFPVIGSPIIGILFGMLFALWQRPRLLDKGISYTSKKLLKLAIILIGFNMNLSQIIAVGSETLVLMLFTLSATFMTAYVVGRLLKVDRNANILVGVGTAICGGSAIAATAPIIEADDSEIAGAISTIFLFNVIAAFAFPAFGHVFHMTDHFFGVWAGTAINDTSSVVAAGYAYSTEAGNLAVIVKLTRTLMIIPVTLVLSIFQSKRNQKLQIQMKAGEASHSTFSLAKVFPWFVIGFILTAVVNTFVGPLWQYGDTFSHWASTFGKFLIVMAMVAIGLNTHIVKLLKHGFKPLVLGFVTWIVLAVTSILVQVLLTFSF